MLISTVESRYKQLFRQQQNVAYIEILLILRLKKINRQIDEKEHLMASGRHSTFLIAFKAYFIKNDLKGAIFLAFLVPFT